MGSMSIQGESAEAECTFHVYKLVLKPDSTVRVEIDDENFMIQRPPTDLAQISLGRSKGSVEHGHRGSGGDDAAVGHDIMTYRINHVRIKIQRIIHE